MKQPSIKCISISDVHLGNKRNTATEIISNLNAFFNDYKPIDDLDILFIAGDLFDTFLQLATPDSAEITIWMNRLVMWCARNNIRLRVLEGTPSHDWRQSRLFETVISVNGVRLDFKYVDTLYIEHIEDLGIDVLYVPDEWSPSTDKTLEQVRGLLASNGINKVDLAIMHGQFGYQLPSAAMKAPRHDENAYLNLVRHFISIGHVHVHSVYGRILAQGSFDRLSHNEESPKGGIEFTIHSDGSREFFFIENKRAKIFKTVTCKDKDIDVALRYIDKQTKSLPIDSHVRIRASKMHPIMSGVDELKNRYPHFVITKIAIEEEVEETELALEEVIEHYSAIAIDKMNITDLLLAEIVDKNQLTNTQVAYITNELRGVL